MEQLLDRNSAGETRRQVKTSGNREGLPQVEVINLIQEAQVTEMEEEMGRYHGFVGFPVGAAGLVEAAAVEEGIDRKRKRWD
jgi:hypothetical protein